MFITVVFVSGSCNRWCRGSGRDGRKAHRHKARASRGGRRRATHTSAGSKRFLTLGLQPLLCFLRSHRCSPSPLLLFTLAPCSFFSLTPRLEQSLRLCARFLGVVERFPRPHPRLLGFARRISGAPRHGARLSSHARSPRPFLAIPLQRCLLGQLRLMPHTNAHASELLVIPQERRSRRTRHLTVSCATAVSWDCFVVRKTWISSQNRAFGICTVTTSLSAQLCRRSSPHRR